MKTIPAFPRFAIPLVTLAWLLAPAAQAQSSSAQLTQLSGTVEVRSSKAPAKAAQLNTPITARSIINTRQRARSELRIGQTIVKLDAESELEITRLDQQQISLKLHYGSVYLQAAGANVQLRSAQGVVSLQDGAQLRMDAVTQPDATAMRLFTGGARFSANGGAPYDLPAGSQYALRASQGPTVSSITRDEFDDWCLDGQSTQSAARVVSYEPVRRVETVRETRTVVNNPSSNWDQGYDTVTYVDGQPYKQTYTQTYSQPYGQPYGRVVENRTVIVNRPDPYWVVAPLVVGSLLWWGSRHYHHHSYYRPHGYHHHGGVPFRPGHWRR
ncbi:MAG: hypothetical protein RL748_1802 [Pseudomonadota bacterium]|jgi:hypothetical protein